MRSASFALSIALSFAVTGCLQVTQSWTIYPDGSGKLTIKTVLKSDKQNASGSVPGSPSFGGVIPVSSRVEPAAEPGHVVVVQESVFEDFNKVTYKKRPVGSFQRVDGGFQARLFKEATGRAVPGAKPGADGRPAMDETAVMKMVAAQMKGMVYRMEIRMPGKLAKTNGETAADKRTAVLEVTEQTLIDDKTRAAISKMDALEATCGPALAAVIEEARLFKDEIAKAKEAHASDFGARSMDDIIKQDEALKQEAEKAEGMEDEDEEK